MTDFTASNGVRISRRPGHVNIWAPSGGKYVGGGIFGTALAEYVDNTIDQSTAYRDEVLERWRYPENPAYVVYPRGDDRARVLNELTGESHEVARDDGRSSWLPRLAAFAYFDSHPELEPWKHAKHGEVWEFIVAALGARVASFQPTRHGWYWTHNGARADLSAVRSARRIWPEVKP